MTDLRKAAQDIVNAEYAEVNATLCYVPKELLEALRQALTNELATVTGIAIDEGFIPAKYKYRRTK